MGGATTDQKRTAAHDYLKLSAAETLRTVEELQLLNNDSHLEAVVSSLLQIRTFVDAHAADNPQVTEIMNSARQQAQAAAEKNAKFGGALSAVERLRSVWRSYMILLKSVALK